ncbi:MAG: hypothetical protein KC944_25200, partial [Candidatus Omnitrophica bacterium]|nr:hypothetical protein [Candidatus Omnitrophota bacterium]
MFRFAFIASFISLFFLTHPASAELDLSGAPEMPKGYETREALEKDLFSGKIPVIQMNDSEIPEGVKFEKNIVFKKTDEKDLILDLYTHPGSDEKAPLLVFIHGGAWRGGKPADYHYYCVKFA